MQFIRMGDYLAVSRITGPKHNLLQLRLGSAGQADPACECIPRPGSTTPQPLDERELVASVLKGVSAANAQLGCKHEVTHIRYAAGDSKPESIYEYMAFKLVEALETGHAFEAS